MASGGDAYRVLFRVSGRLRSETFHDAKAAAEFGDLVDRIGGEAAIAIRDARTASAAGGSPTITLEQWFEHHLAHATSVTPGTIAEYRRVAARTWMPTLGPLPLDAITRDTVARWIGEQARTTTRRGTPTSSKTIANAHGLLSTVLASAADAGRIPSNPCRGLGIPRTERGDMVFLTQAEYAVLISKVPAYWQPLVNVLAGTGLRWGEATALRWGDLDLDADVPVLRVHRAWKKGEAYNVLGAPKTRRSLRTVSLPDQVVDELRPLARGTDELVFVAPRGGMVHAGNFRDRIWVPARDAARLGRSRKCTTCGTRTRRGLSPPAYHCRSSSAALATSRSRPPSTSTATSRPTRSRSPRKPRHSLSARRCPRFSS